MKNILKHLLICLVGSMPLYATNYYVGPGREYTSLNDVVNLLAAGDTVFVDGDHTYQGGIEFEKTGSPDNPIVIKGVRINGKRPVISGGTNTVMFSTYPYDAPGADHYVLEGFDITGGSERGIFHQADDLTVRDCVVHDCPNHGILGADQGSGSLTLEFVEVYNCGNGTQKHQLYISSDQTNHPGSVFRMQFCYIHDGNGGNNLKSRAERNEIYYNWFEGAAYHEIELIGPEPDIVDPAKKREDSDVVGNVIWDKNDFYLTRVGGDGTGETNGRYRFVNNTFITSSRAAFRIMYGIESIEMYNNVFYRQGSGAPKIFMEDQVSWLSGSQEIYGSNNWVESGASSIPSQWQNTIDNSDPMFTNIAQGDLMPVANSPLRNSGQNNIEEPKDFEFPNPLKKAIYQPCSIDKMEDLKKVLRPVDQTVDIGAYENSDIATGLNEYKQPDHFNLDQNYPNPFNPETVINYQLPRSGNVKLVVYDLTGREVKTLTDSRQNAGAHNVIFNASGLSSGIYFYTLTAESFSQTRRMVVLK